MRARQRSRAEGRRLFSLVLALFGTPLLAQPLAEPPFRDYGRAFLHYASVTRPDGTLRRLFVDAATPPRFAAQGFLPDRTEILMETFSPGASVPRVEYKRWKQGGWLFSSFAPEKPNFDAHPDPVCEACHVGAARRFELFTYDSLRRFATDGIVDRFRCEAPGREPCAEAVYRRR